MEGERDREKRATAAGLSKLDVLVAQLESIVASASSKPPDPLICFDLLADLLSSIELQPKETVLGCQRKCEDALQALLLIGVRPPVRRLSAKALVKIVSKGDSISIYSRASSLQGLLLESKKLDSIAYIGLADCLGSLYRSFGQKLTSGLSETTNIVAKLLKFPEVSVRQAALQLLQDVLVGFGGGGSLSAYSEALRLVLRVGAVDKSPFVRVSAAACLQAFALSGAPGIGVGGLESCCTLCVKMLEDPSETVRNAYASALGTLLAIGLNPDAQVHSHGGIQSSPVKTFEGGIQKHLIVPFMRVHVPLHCEIRVAVAMAWVAFLQGMHYTFGHSDLDLQNFALHAMSMLSSNSKLQTDAHGQACIIYILRVGVVELMGEPAQKEFLLLLTKQLSLVETNASTLVVILRTISHLLTVLGEVPPASCEALENLLLVTLSNTTAAVRVETALTIRALAEVWPSCANSLMSFGVTTIHALRETVAIERGDRLKREVDSLHGQALMLGAILGASLKLPLGVPSRLPSAVFELAKKMVLENGRNSLSIGSEKESGWLLIAAIVSSMTREEIQEQEFDIIALWTVPFGGNSEARLRQAERNLGAEICCWTAAVEALTAFIKCYVVPNLSTRKEGILLQPVLGYLNGALSYLSSSILQQAPTELQQLVDIFLMRMLSAYSALLNPFCYKSDHNALLSICTAPFREPVLGSESSCLRQLLDQRDASLGPWIPGRNSFEDELRAFQGALDGPLPCVWESDISTFPQPLSVSQLLVNQKLLCFGSIFAVQREAKKMQLLDIIEGSVKASKKQSFQEINATNACVALLAAVKETLRLRSAEYETQVNKRLQLIFQGFLAEETSSVAQRRAASEGLGILARLGDDVFAARLMRSLLADAASVSDVNLKGSVAFALGCIHKSKGGMALSVLVPATVQTLCNMMRDSKAILHKWALHGLWLTTEAAGLAFVPHVQATMAVVMDALLSEEDKSSDLQQSLGRLINAIVAVVGPELSPGSSFFSRCKSVLAEIAFGEDPAALLESVLFTQQLVLFAPQAVSFHTHVQTLTPTLSAKQPSLRQAAVSTLRHLAERDPIAMIQERIEEKLFAMLDTEANGKIIRLVRLTLLRLLEAASPLYASRWLLLCKNVVLATPSTISMGNKNGAVVTASRNLSNPSKSLGGDEEEMMSRVDGEGTLLTGSELVDIRLKEGEQLPRYSTRLFAAECLSRLPYAVGEDNRHFNLLLAREDAEFEASSDSEGDWLVNHLGQLVALAYQIATGVFESLRPKGVMLLVTIIKKFGRCEDPDLGGHLLLEQYQAQFVSAVRTALDLNASPLLLEAGLQLAAMIITSGIASEDQSVFRRLLALMSNLLKNFDDLQFPSFAEWVGCKVQVTLLCAYASVKSYACVCMTGNSSKMKEGLALMTLVASEHQKLRELWMGLLRDVTVLRMYPVSQLQTSYSPFLKGILLPSVAAIIQPLLDEVWPVMFEALTFDVEKGNLCSISINLELTDEASGNYKNNPDFCYQIMPLTLMEFNQLWLLSFSVLCPKNKSKVNLSSSSMAFHASSFKFMQADLISDHPQVIAFQGIHHLSVKGLECSSFLTTDLSEELFQVFICSVLKLQSAASKYIMPILKQVVKKSPNEYFHNDEWTSALIEACVYHGRQIISSKLLETVSLLLDAEDVVCNTLETFELLAQRLSQRHEQLLPIILSFVTKFIMLPISKGNSLSMALNLIMTITTMLVKLGDQQFIVVASVMQSIVDLVKSLIKNLTTEEYTDEQISAEKMHNLSVILDLSARLAQVFLEIGHDGPQRYSIIDCCIKSFHLTLTASYVEAQLAGLQALRTIAQTAIAESKQGSSCGLAVILMKELGADIVSYVYMHMKNPLTSKAAISVGERLKLLLLLLSLCKDDEPQTEVMSILLPAIVCAASPDMKTDVQIAMGLKMVAVKLVTHLAAQTTLALPFRTVLSNMPLHFRLNLQEIIRASIFHSATLEAAPAIPVTAQKLVIPSSFSAVTSSQAPASSSVSDKERPSMIQSEKEEGAEDEDWDDFQSHPLEDPFGHESKFSSFNENEVEGAPIDQSASALKTHVDEVNNVDILSDENLGVLHRDKEAEEIDECFDSFQGVEGLRDETQSKDGNEASEVNAGGLYYKKESVEVDEDLDLFQGASKDVCSVAESHVMSGEENKALQNEPEVELSADEDLEIPNVEDSSPVRVNPEHSSENSSVNTQNTTENAETMTV